MAGSLDEPVVVFYANSSLAARRRHQGRAAIRINNRSGHPIGFLKAEQGLNVADVLQSSQAPIANHAIFVRVRLIGLK
jgi:hypothetical protein